MPVFVYVLDLDALEGALAQHLDQVFPVHDLRVALMVSQQQWHTIAWLAS